MIATGQTDNDITALPTTSTSRMAKRSRDNYAFFGKRNHNFMSRTTKGLKRKIRLFPSEAHH